MCIDVRRKANKVIHGCVTKGRYDTIDRNTFTPGSKTIVVSCQIVETLHDGSICVAGA